MNNKLTQSIAANGIIAALYVILTLITYPISFEGIQFRFAEILVLLTFFRKDYTFGICLGCALANIASPLGFFDVLFGTLATLLSCVCIFFCKHLLLAVIFPVIFNGVIVGLELYWLLNEPLFISMLSVALGELVVMIVGYFIFFSFRKRPQVLKSIGALQNIDFKF